MEIYQLKAVFKTDRKCVLPRFKTMMFRGIFGNAYSKTKCINTKTTDCFKCYLAAKCEFAVHFHNMNFYPQNLQKKYQRFRNFPAKYVFYISEEKHYYGEGESLEVLISFIGYPQISLQDLVESLKNISDYTVDRKSEARLIFDSLSDNSSQSLLYKNDRFYSKQLIKKSLKKINSDVNTLEFITLCRISSNDMLVSNEINAYILTRRIKERLNLLTIGLEKTYQPDWQNEEVELISKDLHWLDVKHSSNRQKNKIILGGFLGQINLKCRNHTFWKDIALLEHIHIGTNAQGGYGKFTILNQGGTECR